MQRQEMITTLIDCVARSLALDAGEMNLDSRIIDDLGADSLDFMDIMFQLEDAFGINLQKEDLNFLLHIGMTREEAVSEDYLTPAAKQRLREWMPTLEIDKTLKPADLSHYLTIESLLLLVMKKRG